MALSFKHLFASVKSDGVDSTLIQPSNWNAEHVITMAAGKVLGRDKSAAGAAQELPLEFSADRLTLTFASTDAGSGLSPTLSLYRDSVSPANGDNLAAIQFRGNDSLGNITTYAMIYSWVSNTVDATEGGGLSIQTMRAGTLTEAVQITSVGKVGFGTTSPALFGSLYNDFVIGTDRPINSGQSVIGTSLASILFANNVSGSETHRALIQMDMFLGRLSIAADSAVPLINIFDATSAYNGRVGVGNSTPSVKLDVTGAIKTNTVTVAGLATAASAGAGARHFVTDATVTTFASIVVGGGANGVPVYSDGTNWRIG